jgi:hypothetical protein
MTQQKHQLLDQDYFCDSTKVRPWLDGMIGRANEVLNALLRLRKQQMTAEMTRLHGTGGHGTSDDGDCHSFQVIPFLVSSIKRKDRMKRKKPSGYFCLCVTKTSLLVCLYLSAFFFPK